MPHFESLERGAWVEAAHAAGITLIDPRGDPSAILASIGACRVMLSEAMHGVIVADAMRVPWIALRPLVSIHRAKWQDWAGALGLRLRFQLLAASSLAERLHASPLAAPRRCRHLLDLAHPTLHAAARRRFIEQAARSLTAAAASAPQLSTATALDRCRTRMLDRLDALRRDPCRPGNAPVG
jgi:succinoglycan biosynthesis protein ExoV